MRILYLHRTQGRSVESVHIRGIVDAAREAGHHVLIEGPPGTDPYASGGEGPSPNLAVSFAKYAPEMLFEMAEILYDRRLSLRLRSVIRNFRPDLIYERYAFFGTAGSDLAARLRIPHVIEVNYTCDDPLVRRRSRVMRPLSRRVERRIFRRAAVLAPVSSRLVERLTARGVDPAKITLTPNAVSRAWLADTVGVEPIALPAAFGDLPVTGFVGGFWPWHGLERLVAAAVRARDAGCPTALLLVGDGPEREPIRQLVAEAGLADLVHMPGNIPHARLAPWIAAMDVCVMPHSNDYGSPMKVFEYMSFARPVLAPQLPPLEDVIDDGVNGRLFADGADTGAGGDALGDVLIELLRDEKARTRMGEAAAVRMRREFTWQANLNRIFAVLGQDPPFPEEGGAS